MTEENKEVEIKIQPRVVSVIPPEVAIEDLIALPAVPEEETPEKTEQLNTKLGYRDLKSNAGATATVVLVTPTHVYCANAGDSRTIVSRADEQAMALSKDHKPNSE